MEDRKLYHLVNGEFVHDGMPYLRTPTYEEVNAHIAILQDVGFFDDPVAESVPAWDGLSSGKRTTEKQASLYDAMLAEILGLATWAVLGISLGISWIVYAVRKF